MCEHLSLWYGSYQLYLNTTPIIGHVGCPLPCCKVKLVDVPEMGYYAKDNKGEVCCLIY